MAAKIMIIRHAEKPEDPVQGVDVNGNNGEEFLTVRGWQRAGALVGFFAPFGNEVQHAGIGRPQFLFAAAAVSKAAKKAGNGSKSFRPQQTIAPLSELLGAGVPLNLSFGKGQEQEVAAAARDCDGVALIAWQHEDIPAIANAIPVEAGVVPAQWPGNRFDIVWVFDLQPGGNYSFSEVPQMLLDGDLPTPIA